MFNVFAKKNPKAAVRNRGKCVFPAESKSVNDKKDHFPIGNAAQARNALARANQFKKAPKWYRGSLQSFVSSVVRAVKKEYPSIQVSKEAEKPGAAKKKAFLFDDSLIEKFAQMDEEWEEESYDFEDPVEETDLQEQISYLKNNMGKNKLEQGEIEIYLEHIEVEDVDRALDIIKKFEKTEDSFADVFRERLIDKLEK